MRFGCRFAALIGIAALAGCTRAQEVSWRVVLGEAAEGAARVELTVFEGACGASGDPLYETVVDPAATEERAALPDLGHGERCFQVVVVGEDCVIRGEGRAIVTLPTDGDDVVTTVELLSDPRPRCMPKACVDGECVTNDAGPSDDAGPTDAGPTDAGPTDAGPLDGGPPDTGPRDAGPPPRDPVAVAAGTGHTCALREDGTVTCWGSNILALGAQPPGDVPGLSDAEEIACGNSYCCARTAGDLVRCWGWGADALGVAGSPRLVMPPSSGVSFPGAMLRSIGAGGGTTCAVLDSGAQCWGQGESYQRGDQLNVPSSTALPSALFGGNGIAQIQQGATFGCYRDDGGGLACWGDNGQAQLGRGNTSAAVPVPGTYVSNVSTFALGGSHGCAVIAGTTSCWGSNNFSQCGRTTPSTLLSRSPVTLPTPVTALASGTTASCAIANGNAWCWGHSKIAGDPASFEPVPTPVQVTLPDVVRDLAIGASHACAVLQNGAVHCWGDGALGQLGGASAHPSAPFTASIVVIAAAP